MRVVCLPSSLNAESGLVCMFIGDRKDLEALSVREIVDRSKPIEYVWPMGFLHGYPEPFRAVKAAQR